MEVTQKKWYELSDTVEDTDNVVHIREYQALSPSNSRRSSYAAVFPSRVLLSITVETW